MKKSENFLYQLNINCKKYPDICKVLEEEKANNGIAFYLRNLIQQDIERRSLNFLENETIPKVYKNTEVIQLDSSKKDEDKELDSTGGFI